VSHQPLNESQSLVVSIIFIVDVPALKVKFVDGKKFIVPLRKISEEPKFIVRTFEFCENIDTALIV
jgi:hypothetical protein